MSNLVLRANLSRPLTHNELDANMQFLEIVEWSAKDFRADQFAYVTVTGTTTLYLCLQTHTAFVYDNNSGDFAETITVDGTPITLWRKISGSGGGTGAEFVNAEFDSGTNIITFTAADGSTVDIDLSSVAGGGTGTSGTSGNSGSSGTSGLTGTAGSAGSSGLSYGTSGSSGSSGTSGFTGSSGSSGADGLSVVGPDGSSGSSGENGSSGSSGESGSSGTSGESGSSGSSGFTGTAGSSGSSGSSGESGTSGANGDLYKTTSPTSHMLGSPGTITVDTGLAYTTAQSIVITFDINNYQECEVINYDGTSGVLTFGVPTRVVGAPGIPYNSWTVNLDGASGGDGTSGTAGTSGTSGSTGSSGSSGTAGTSGTSGGPGTSGTSGGPGTSGTAGVSDKYLGSVLAPVDYSSLSIPTPMTVTTTPNLSYSPGESVVVAYDISNYAEGRVITYNPATGQLAITLTNIVFATSGGVTPSTSNLQGTIGATGSSGSSGASGTFGSSGESGSSGTAGADGGTGTSGTAGAAGTSGTSSSGGGTSTVYNNVSRYLAYNSGSANIYIVSSATVNTGLSWSISGTTVTITHNNHGRSNGEAVIIRNVNIDNEYCIISNVSTNTFDITVSSSSGASSGSAAAYSLGFTVSSVSAAGATIVAPSGGDVQLMSYYHATGARSGVTYALTTPISAINGGGDNSALNNSYFPIIRVQDLDPSGGGTIVGASMTLNTGANYHIFNLASLSLSNPNGIRMVF
jgi:hypothetical protein